MSSHHSCIDRRRYLRDRAMVYRHMVHHPCRYRPVVVVAAAVTVITTVRQHHRPPVRHIQYR